MRQLATNERVKQFIHEFGNSCDGPGCVYLVGGATAVLIGWRDTTVDVDLKLQPEPSGAFRAIAALKERMDINVELASPDAFVPPIPGWQDRSTFIERVRNVEFKHYDFYTQAFAKIERGHVRDLADVRAMIDRKCIDPRTLEQYIRGMLGKLERYPHLDERGLRLKIDAFFAAVDGPT